MATREEIIITFTQMQRTIIEHLQSYEPTVQHTTEHWQRPPETGISYGGGGMSCLLRNGDVFEQAGVNFSAVEGHMSPEMCEKLVGVKESLPFFATGVSLVFHPLSPRIPTTHANTRYLEVGEFRWCGGGADLTPYSLVEADARHFHGALKKWCDSASTDYYSQFKKWCDEYFYLPHRKETRGVGGVFFDYLGRDTSVNKSVSTLSFTDIWSFSSGLGQAFIEGYFPLVAAHLHETYTDEERQFQLLRRGRYVEFNLLYDRGTKFGLETGGRTQSILMSLPPTVCWDESFKIQPSSPQAKLLEVLHQPREWV
jgi:coproporphyrinogen III oxidase